MEEGPFEALPFLADKAHSSRTDPWPAPCLESGALCGFHKTPAKRLAPPETFLWPFVWGFSGLHGTQKTSFSPKIVGTFLKSKKKDQRRTPLNARRKTTQSSPPHRLFQNVQRTPPGAAVLQHCRTSSRSAEICTEAQYSMRRWITRQP